MMLVVMLALMLVDVVACFRSGLNTLATLCGKAPRRCQRACRLIVNQLPRTTCGRPCCLPEDHGPVWNHSCPEHVQLGGRVSNFEYKTYMLFKWWHRLMDSMSTTCHLTMRTVWKWAGCRWAIMFLLYTAFLTPKPHDMYRPELAQEDRLRLPEPRDQVAGLVELSDGYHKRVRVYVGMQMQIAMLDA